MLAEIQPNSMRLGINVGRGCSEMVASTQLVTSNIFSISRRRKCANLTCGVSLKNGYHVDHILAIALGGLDDLDNLQLLCPQCNRRKGAKTPEQWTAESGLIKCS